MRKLRAPRAVRAVSLLALLVAPLLLFSYYEEVHKLAAELALRLLEKSDSGRLYAEVYSPANRARLVAGAWMEDFGAVDGNERSFRHYYEPTTGLGCPYLTYFPVWEELDGASVAYRGRNYPSALEWARDGAGTQDLRNWKGAIKAYDYTPSARAEAYFRLGHVVHLLADMAEPDHATNTVHAASGYAYPRDLNLILAFIKGKVDPLPGFWVEKSVLERSMAYFAARGVERLGFEGFIEERHAVLFPSLPQVKSNKRLTLDGYFRTMAELSQGAIRDKGFPVPIGVRKHPYATEADQAALGALGANYSFFPSIDFEDAAESARYLGLARELLTSATRLNAGLLEFFYDIVNPPPYVRSVRIGQGGRPVYHAFWKDIKHTVEGVHPNENAKAADMLGKKGFDHKYRYETVSRRELVGQPDEGAPAGEAKLEPGVAAEIRVEFGPEPAGFDAPPERMESASVFIGGHAVPGRLVDNGTAWVGRFTPVLEDGEDVRELQIEIHGRDARAHIPLRGRLALPDLKDLTSDRGFLLDSEPDSPAKTSSENLSAYHVASYQPGPDRNFRVAVGRASPREKPAEEAAAVSLTIGEVWGPPGDGNVIWQFYTYFRSSKRLGLDLIEVERWILYGDPRDSRYHRWVREGGDVVGYMTSNIVDFTRPADERLGRIYAAKRQLELERYSNEDSQRFEIIANSDPVRVKVVCKAVGADGRIFQAECFFDSKEWVPSGEKDRRGVPLYRKR